MNIRYLLTMQLGKPAYRHSISFHSAVSARANPARSSLKDACPQACAYPQNFEGDL